MPRSNLQTPSSPGSLAPAPLDYNEQLSQFQGAFGNDGPLGALKPLPQTSAYDAEVEKQKREASTTTSDYVDSAVRQDSPVDGMVASFVGSQFKPDPTFNPYAPEVYKELTKGLPEEFHNEMLKAVSPEHAIYIRERLDDKLADERKLGDLGVPGNIARFLGGLVEPTNLALGLASGGVTSAVRAGVAAKAIAGVASAGAGGYALERARQKYNFEDSQGDAVWAGLMGMAFSTPFVGLHAREMAATRRIASRELEVLNAARDNAPTESAGKAALEIEQQTKALAPEYTDWPPARENGPVEAEHAVALPQEEPHAAQMVDDLFGHTEEAPTAPAANDESVFDGFKEGSVGSARVGEIPTEITGMSRARFDIYARLNRSENPVVQGIAEKLVKDGIAKRTDGEAVAQPRTASEDKKVLQRTVAGNFHFDAATAYKDAAKKMGWGWWDRNKPSNIDGFYQKVGQAMRDERVYADNPLIADELRKAVGAARNVYSTMLDHMQSSGVKGAEALKQNPDYMNRVWKQSSVREMAVTHGDDEVHRLVASAIRDKDGMLARFREKNPESKLTDDQVLQGSAKKFVDSIMALEHSHLSTELLLTATDAPTLRSELRKAKLSDAEVESVIDNLFEVQEATSGDAGKPGNLKYRFNLDEGASIRTEKGANLKLTDLMENDSRLLVDRYMSSMAGHVALARRGIKSRADFNALLREADQNHEAEALGSRDASKFSEEKQMLSDMYDNITGRPMSVHSFNLGDRMLTTTRAYARSVYLGQLGFTAMNEAFHAAGLSTWRAALQQMPSLGEFLRAARAGHAPTEGLSHDIRTMLGFLNEHVSGYLRQHEITDFTYDKRLHALENGANTLSHAVDKFSGNSFVTSFTRGYAAAWMTQKYANFAHGLEPLTQAWRDRIVGNGVKGHEIDKMLEHLKTYAEMDGKRVSGINWEAWSAKDPKTYHDFTTAVDRDVRQAIQDHDIGETWMFQHTSLGKFLTELRAFNIAGHSKQMLNSLHYRDRTSLFLWNSSFATNALAYIVQTSANYGHDPKELDKRLTAGRIVNAAYQRSNMMGVVPFLTQTLLPGFVSAPIQSGTTANTDSRNILMPPSFNLLAKGVNFMQHGNPQDGFTLLPFSNTYGARNLANWLGKAYPHTQPPQH